MTSTARAPWLAVALQGALLPVGVALAVGLALAELITPRWIVGGLPWATGYPKNVELLAASWGTAAGGASGLLMAWRGGRLAAAALAAAGYAALAWMHPAALPVGAPVLLAAAGLAMALARAIEAPIPAAPPGGRGAALVALGVLAALLFVHAIGPKAIDVYHDGEFLASAVDLLDGGTPFVTFFWPHGASDTGLTALWILITGKVGSSPVALALATVVALAAPALYLTLRGALGSAPATALACWLIVAGWFLLRHSPYEGWLATRATGMLVFAALAFAAAAARPRPQVALAGAALALGYVYRLDAGVYAAGAVAVVLAARLWLAGGAPAARLGRLLRAGLLGTAALLATLLALWAVLGWPGPAWYAYTLGPMPRFHAGNNGLPFPWAGLAPARAAVFGVIALLVPVVLLATALRAVARRWRAGLASGARLELALFLGAFAMLALHTALSRSDPPHLVHWTWYPFAAALALCLAEALARAAQPPRHALRLTGGLAATFALVVLLGPRDSPARLLEHLRPNAPAGACADRMFTARDREHGAIARLIRATCQVEHLLRAHGVARVFVEHSAPWYYVRFGQPFPTPYYALNRAFTLADQEQVIADLRRYQAGALLKVRGFQALEHYDVHNIHHAPVVEAYLRARRGDAPAVDTGLGRLIFWDEPDAPPPAPPPPGPLGTDLGLAFGTTTYDPVSGFLEARGWAVDERDLAPVAHLIAQQPGGQPELRREARPDVARLLAAPQALRSGWRLVMRAAPDEWRQPEVGLLLAAADGRQRFAPLAALPVTVLPPLDGVDPLALAAAVDGAEALGRADRAAALAARRAAAPAAPTFVDPPAHLQ